MEVIVLGSGVIGLTSAWYLSQAGLSSHGHRSPTKQRDGNKLCQCRANFLWLLIPMGGSGYPAQGDQMADGRTRSTKNKAVAQHRHDQLGKQDGCELHLASLSNQQSSHAVYRQPQPNLLGTIT